MIEVSHLKKTYFGKKHLASRGLQDVSFKLPDKGFVFVLGKSGSGKSTLLNMLGNLDQKTDGKIFIEGKDLDTFTPKEIDSYRSSYCGFIFQDYQLINELTVRENIALSLDLISDFENREERIDDILRKVELEEYQNKLPTELSGGQKQRVSIARALVKRPKLILCDEPTGNLDRKTSKAILDLLKEISKECLVFMVSHDENASILYADRRIILENGLVKRDEVRDPDYKNELYYNQLLPERFGRKREYALGKLSGQASINENLLELGIQLGKKYVQKVTERIVQLGDKKEIVTQDDLPYIVADIVKHDTMINKVKIVNYSLNMSHGLHPTATVKLEVDGKEYEQSAYGDGQFDAFIKTIKKIYTNNLKRELPRLTNYTVSIPPHGSTDALVMTNITWNYNGRIIKTRGLEVDQIEAALQATIKMLNIIEGIRK